MKRILAIFSLFALTVFADETMPPTEGDDPVPPITGIYDNQYSGSGAWTDSQGNTGEYSVQTSFHNNVMTSQYQWGDTSYTLSLTFVFTGSGNFDLYNGGIQVTSGSCENTLPMTCTYSYNSGPVSISETLQFLSGIDGLVKTGHKVIDGHTVSWRERLLKLKS